jgi:hypothetical protein
MQTKRNLSLKKKAALTVVMCRFQSMPKVAEANNIGESTSTDSKIPTYLLQMTTETIHLKVSVNGSNVFL